MRNIILQQSKIISELLGMRMSARISFRNVYKLAEKSGDEQLVMMRVGRHRGEPTEPKDSDLNVHWRHTDVTHYL